MTGSLSLADTPLFRDLPESELSFVSGYTTERTLVAREALVEIGHEAPGLFVISSGSAGVFVGAESSGREIASLGPGDVVGEIALLTGEPCSATVVAAGETKAWFIDRLDFPRVIEHCPGLWRNLVSILSQRLVRTTRRLASEPSQSSAALVLACQPEDEISLVTALSTSLAQQTNRPVLVIDGRAPGSGPLGGKAQLPSVAAVLADRTLLRAHETAAASSSVSIAPLDDDEHGALTDEQALRTIEWLSPFYGNILILLTGPPSDARPDLMHGVRSIMTVVSEDDVQRMVSWLSRLSTVPGERVGAAILSNAQPSAEAMGQLETQLGRPALAVSREPNLSQAGDDSMARIARHLGGMTIGVALGAGAAKGLAHIGVLRVLQQNNVPIDYVAGSSIGSIVGALFAGGFPLDDIEEMLNGADRKVVRWTLPLTALWSDRGLRRLLSEPGPTTEFHELRTPFAAVATDLISGREVILREGIVWRAVQASVSIPGMFPPAVISGRFLVDGGVVSPVPTRAARDLGADIVIAVDLSSPGLRPEAPTRLAATGDRERAEHTPRIIEVLWRSTEIMQTEMTAHTAAIADVTIAPSLGRSRFSDFTRRPAEFVTAGAEAAEAAMPEIRNFLPWLQAEARQGAASS
jgi:NTE family protein